MKRKILCLLLSLALLCSLLPIPAAFAAQPIDKVDLTVVKNGKVEDGKEHIQVNGITGATLTSNGVADMVTTGLQAYDKFLRANR